MRTRIIPLSLLFALSATACEEGGDTDYGELRMGLIGSDVEGNLYRLRDGTFTILGPPDASVSTEDGPDPVETLLVGVPAGAYTVGLEDGWRVERWDPTTDTTQDVAALLTSANPVGADVMAEITTPVVFTFFVDGAGPVPMGDGGIEIDVSFSDECAQITDPATCDGFESCQWDPTQALCVEAGSPPASGTVEWIQQIDIDGADDSFSEIDVDGQGRIVAVGSAGGPIRGLIVELDTSGTTLQTVLEPSARMQTIAFDEANLAWLGRSGPGQSSDVFANSFDPSTGILNTGPFLGAGPVIDSDAATAAVYLTSNFRLIRLTPGGSIDSDLDAFAGGPPLAVAASPTSPARSFVLSRDGGQLRLREYDNFGIANDTPIPFFANNGAEMAARPDGSVIIAAADGSDVSILSVQPGGGSTTLLTMLSAAPDSAQTIGLDIATSGEAAVGFRAGPMTNVARISTDDGTIQWQLDLAPADIEGNDVAIGPDGAVYVAGDVNPFASPDAAVLRIAP